MKRASLSRVPTGNAALFGLLAVELAVSLTASQHCTTLTHILAAAFFVASFVFVYRSFYGMRIKGSAA